MEDEFNIYSSLELLAIIQDPRLSISTRPWRNFFSPRVHLSEQREIAFAEIEASRPVAPFMYANLPGRPIFKEDGMALEWFRPAYTKPKDQVMPGEVQGRTAEELLGISGPQSLQSRFDRKVLRILQFHDQAIDRLVDWMFAHALIYAQVPVKYQTESGLDGEEVIIDFGRDPAHNIAYDAGRNWAGNNFDIVGDIETTANMVANAEFGGNVDTLLLGSEAAARFTASARTKDSPLQMLLDRNIRGADDIMARRGIIIDDPMNPFTYLGNLSGIDVWRVAGRGNQFQNADGTFANIVEPKQAVYISSGVDAVEAYGAIMDVNNLVAVPKWPKMWDENDPSARFIMTQSAPLAIVPYPNSTAVHQVLN